MVSDPRVRRLLEEVLDSGRTPDEVCSACPELLMQVRKLWRRLRAVEAQVDVLFPTLEPAQGTEALVAGPPPGELPHIPGYEVEAELGRGGMGIVYKAQHLGLNRPVALKMLLAGPYARAEERVRFQREAEAVAALRHANIVQIHDVGEQDGRPYFTLEFVEGGTLAQKLTGAPLPARAAAALVATLAEAVEAAHQGGIVHRDLKPANVLLTADGTPKITDFGLARRLDGEASLTHSGTPMGTPCYMAPEQVWGKTCTLGPAVDVWALGVILYELLTGRVPFWGETAAQTTLQVIEQEPVPPSRLNPRVPRDLETICLKCLQKEPQRRYASAAALAADLQRFERGESIAARRAGRLERLARWARRRPAVAAASGAVVLLLLALIALVGGGLWLSRQQAATAQAVEDDLHEADRLRQAYAWSGARAALERARGRLGTSGRAELHERVAEARRNLELVARLDAIRFTRTTGVEDRVNQVAADREYEEAFQKSGLGQVQEDPEVVAARVAASPVRAALVAALDDWAVIAAGKARRRWLLEVVRRADPDPWRDRVRTPEVWEDRGALAALARTAPVAEQSVPLLVALGERLPARNGARAGFLKRVHQEHPADFWVNYTLGNALRERDPAEALGYYRAALGARPGVVAVWNNLGIALEARGRRDETALRSGPEFAPAHTNRGRALQTKGRLDEAIDHYRRALRLDPNFAAAHGNLGNALRATGQLDDAIDHYREAVRLAPSSSGAHNSLAMALTARGTYAEALEHYRDAVRLDPNHVNARYNLAMALHASHPKEAVPQFEQVLRRAPREFNAHIGLGVALRATGRLDEAIGHFREALRLDPRNLWAMNNLAAALCDKRQPDEAIDLMQQALRIDPKDAWAYTRLGQAVRDKGRLDEAASHYRRALALAPNLTIAQAGLRGVLLPQGRLEEARALWQKMLAADPPDHDDWVGYAELCLFLEKKDEYRRARLALLKRFGASRNPVVAERTGRACLLASASEDELRQATLLIDRALLAGWSKLDWTYPYFLFAKGLAEYRQGRWESASALMEGPASKIMGPCPRLVLAMAQHRRGQQEAARKTLAAALAAFDWTASHAKDHNAWIAHVLRREAEALLRPRAGNLPSGARTATVQR